MVMAGLTRPRHKRINVKPRVTPEGPPMNHPLAVIMGLIAFGDWVLLTLTGIIAHLVLNQGAAAAPIYIIASVALGIAAATALRLAGVYRIDTTDPLEPRTLQSYGVWAITLGLFMAVVFLAKWTDLFARSWILTTFMLGFVGLTVIRVMATQRLSRLASVGRLGPRIAIVGHGKILQHTAETVMRDPRGLARMIGAYDIDHDPKMTVDRIVQSIRDGKANEVLIATHDPQPHLDQLIDRLKDEAVDVRYLLPSTIGSHTILGFERTGGLPTGVLSDRPLPGWNAVIKRIEDLVLGTVLLLLAAPLMAVIALTIRLTMGTPVLFHQQRHGFNNNTFTVLKFRTMTVAEDGPDVHQAQRHDPRVTWLGSVLRRTSLDELPQLFNVIRGNMSLVGPRPHAVSHNTHYAEIINGYLSRHRVKPGITGWAQVNGLRGETDTVEKMRQRVEFDKYYIENWSLTFDLRIIAQTVVTLIGARNAY